MAVCENCGYEGNADGASFCGKCGAPLTHVEEEAKVQEERIQEEQQARVEQVAQDWTCPNCKRTCSSTDKFCPECGIKRPQEARCPRCGRVNKPDARFCAECGHALAPSTRGGHDPNESKERLKVIPVPTLKGGQNTLFLVLDAVLILLLTFAPWFSINYVIGGTSLSLPSAGLKLMDFGKQMSQYAKSGSAGAVGGFGFFLLLIWVLCTAYVVHDAWKDLKGDSGVGDNWGSSWGAIAAAVIAFIMVQMLISSVGSSAGSYASYASSLASEMVKLQWGAIFTGILGAAGIFLRKSQKTVQAS